MENKKRQNINFDLNDRENIENTKKLLEDLKKIPKDARNYALGVIEGAVIAQKSQEEKKGT